MAPPPSDDLEARVRVLEETVGRLRDEVVLSRTDAAAARELAAGADRDVSEVRAELRAHTQTLNALRENQLDLQSEVRAGFAEMRTGMGQIVNLLSQQPGDHS
jgi:chromosome segregation ATPase